MIDIQHLKRSFASYFNSKPAHIVHAPGRVNLIGEHTDYNDGFVLPMAIDRGIWLALNPRDDKTIRLFSLDFETDSSFELSSLTPGRGWVEYPKGIANQLLQAGYELRGFDAIITGDVPRGAGLSSSAALELATARAFSVVSGFEWDAVKMARLSQKAENQWIGVNCGIMDQMASAASKEGHALFLDCRTLEIQYSPLPKGVSIAILDTMTRRGLVDSAYNERRSQCEDAARWFGVKALRDVEVEEIRDWRLGIGNRNVGRELGELSDIAVKRARHVITENARVLEAVEALNQGDVKRLGNLFNASHDSLRNDFEVTNEALDTIFDVAREQAGCYGARMTGAGFGGCAAALIDEKEASAFAEAVKREYRLRSGLEPGVYISQPCDGARVIE